MTTDNDQWTLLGFGHQNQSTKLLISLHIFVLLPSIQYKGKEQTIDCPLDSDWCSVFARKQLIFEHFFINLARMRAQLEWKQNERPLHKLCTVMRSPSCLSSKKSPTSSFLNVGGYLISQAFRHVRKDTIERHQISESRETIQWMNDRFFQFVLCHWNRSSWSVHRTKRSPSVRTFIIYFVNLETLCERARVLSH